MIAALALAAIAASYFTTVAMLATSPRCQPTPRHAKPRGHRPRHARPRAGSHLAALRITLARRPATTGRHALAVAS